MIKLLRPRYGYVKISHGLRYLQIMQDLLLHPCHFFVLIDSYSKWIEVYIYSQGSLRSTFRSTSEVTLEKFRQAFATMLMYLSRKTGPVLQVMNESCFTKENGIVHVKTSPYHPASNRLAEQTVWIFLVRYEEDG